MNSSSQIAACNVAFHPNIARPTAEWETAYRAFQKRSLADRDYVYVWVDGEHLNVRRQPPGLNYIIPCSS